MLPETAANIFRQAGREADLSTEDLRVEFLLVALLVLLRALCVHALFPSQLRLRLLR